MSAVNEIRLVGRLSAAPEERELPSGDVVMLARLVVPREVSEQRPSRQVVDVVDCAGWLPRVQRAMRGWRSGDTVEVNGALRRRFYRAGGRTMASVEVEVSQVRLVRRSTSG